MEDKVTLMFNLKQHCFHTLFDSDENRTFGDGWVKLIHCSFSTAVDFENFVREKVNDDYEKIDSLYLMYSIVSEFKKTLDSNTDLQSACGIMKDNNEPNTRVWSKIMTITPSMAHEWLAKNIVNRPLSKITVKRYAQFMLKGEWELNGESIIFDIDGNLTNGQHRLNAILEASKIKKDITFVTFVTFGVSKKAIYTYDSGKKRSFADAFTLSGINNAVRMSVIVSRELGLRHGMNVAAVRSLGGESFYTISKGDCINEYNEHKDFYQMAARLGSQWCDKNGLRLLTATSYATLFCHLVLDKKHPEDKVKGFFDSLSSMTQERSPIMLLRAKLLKDKISQKKMQSSMKSALIKKAWNAYIRGKEIKTLNWNEKADGDLEFL